MRRMASAEMSSGVSSPRSAAGIVIVRALLDDKIKTAEDIRKYADLPTLAIVPVQEERPTKGASSRKTRRRE